MQIHHAWHQFRLWLTGKSPRRAVKLRRPRRLSFDRLEDRALLAELPELVRDINPAGASNPSNMVEIGGALFFQATDGTNGNELWKSDGTSAGTVLVRDIRPGASSANPRSLTNVNGTLFFQANDGGSGVELWKSDGTSTGTVLVRDIYVGGGSSSPSNLTNVNGTLYFGASDWYSGYELWKSDGTSAGTILVRDINPGTSSANLDSLTNVNGTLFFHANEVANINELWKSDGTSAGTVLVRKFNFDFFRAYPKYLTNVNGTLYFSVDDSTIGSELWKSDGTSAGTALVRDIYRGGTGGSYPHYLTNVNGTLYFVADDADVGVHGHELWKSDGTSVGTVLVKDIWPGRSNALPRYLTNVNGTLYFQANDGSSGSELWKSDGTSAGTVQVRDLMTGSSGALPSSLTNVNGRLFFAASDGATGVEVWSTDGTRAGTVRASDINPDAGSSNPANLLNLNGTAYFAADNGTGAKLWKIKSAFTFSGTTVMASGGPGDNAVVINFNSPTNYTITVDGQANTIDISTYNTIVVDTGGGNDSLTVNLSSLADTAVLNGKTGSVTSSNYAISFSNVETAVMFGSATDLATFNDPGAVNTFTFLAPYSIMKSTAAGYTNQTVGFGGSTGNGVGNNDSIFLYGDSGNQTLNASRTQVSMTVGTQPLVGNNMRNSYAYGTLSGNTGTDSATYNGTSANEVLTSTPAYSVLFSTETLQYFVGFRNVTANSGGGVDSVKMYDSAGNDTFTSSTTPARFFGTTFDYRANGYTRMYAYQTKGNDTATLNGTAGNDRVSSLPTYVILSTSPFIQQVFNFSTVIVNAGTGTDTATLDDSPGNDTLNASGGLAELIYSSGHKVQLNGFDTLTARGTSGGVNRRNVTGTLAYVLNFTGTWV